MSAELRKRIAEVFPKLPATGYRLSDAIVEDDYGDTSYAFTEDWETWDQIEDWQIAKSDVFFSYAPPDAAAYLLPRFMLFVLDEIEGLLSKKYQGYGSGEAAVWHLQRLKNSRYRNTRLDSSQIDVVEQFLAEIYKDVDYRTTYEVGKNQDDPNEF